MPMWPKWSAAIGTSSPTTDRTSATYSQIRSMPFGVRRTWVKGCITWVMLNSVLDLVLGVARQHALRPAQRALDADQRLDAHVHLQHREAAARCCSCSFVPIAAPVGSLGVSQYIRMRSRNLPPTSA